MKNMNVLRLLASVQAKEDNLTNVLENVMEKASHSPVLVSSTKHIRRCMRLKKSKGK